MSKTGKRTGAEAADEAEVTNMEDAASLLSAAKARLSSGEYHRFLNAVSSTDVDVDVAIAVLEGNSDLIEAFRRCFTSGKAAAAMATAHQTVSAMEGLKDEPLGDHKGVEARIGQLVQLLFANLPGHRGERAKAIAYLKQKAEESAFPRRLVLLRGPPGVGKTEHAKRVLDQEGINADDPAVKLAMQLAHICSSDDFFMRFTGAGTEALQFAFNPEACDAAHAMNEARVRLCMEIGLEPIFVDNTNMRLQDMRPYVMLADRMGYVASIVSPAEISHNWNDAEFLQSRTQEKYALTPRIVGRAQLQELVDQFEELPAGVDPKHAIRCAAFSAEPRASKYGVESSKVNTKLPPTAILYKLERLLKDGTDLMRYKPANGKGFGVNGELAGEWHSFREKADGSCQYEDQLQWWTEDPETAWTFAELAQLEDLRGLAAELPSADLPSAASHPSLFSAKTKPGKAPEKAANKPEQKPAARAAQVLVPASRRERFKQRMANDDAQDGPPSKKAKTSAAASVGKKAFPTVFGNENDEDDDVEVTGMPTEQEEMSAATFLAAVKARLTEWGKVEQYHEFVMALSGTVDAKSCVRILRGHDDLLRVFRSKFAPAADLMAIKQELNEEEEEEVSSPVKKPRPPPGPPASMRVKAELQEEHSAGAQRPSPNKAAVKEEMGKADVKSELVTPHPPTWDPHMKRMVTVGDSESEDDDEEIWDEASIISAVRKGRDECIEQLAKTIFRKERASTQGDRPRRAMVRYAGQVAGKPRFPRELFILRGASGVGKTEYAMQQLAEYTEMEADDELAIRLTHVCAADDFFEEFKGDETAYTFDVKRLAAVHKQNELRTRFAMEAGIHPIFVDCSNLRLWEMRPYVLLAEKMGYVTHVVEPREICERWNDLEYLASANGTQERQTMGKVVPKELLASLLKAFEPLPKQDPIQAIAKAQKPLGVKGKRALQPTKVLPQKVPPPRPTVQGKGRGQGGNKGKGKAARRYGAF